jgi:plasmid replication initiation protein
MANKHSNLVTLDNKLAQASYSLSLTEQRLIYIILSKIRPDYFRKETEQETNDKIFYNKVVTKEDRFMQGEDFDSTTLFQLSVQDFAEFCDIRLDNARADLIEASTRLLSRKVTVQKETGGFISFNWLQGIEYDEVTDTISLRWSYYILPYIQNLTKFFTKLRLNELLGLRSTYSWKLYQLLLSKKGENNYKKEVVIAYESMLFSLDVPISCREFKFFNSKILQKSMKEVDKVGLLEELKMKKVLKGKKVVGLSFTWLNVEEVLKKRAAEALAKQVIGVVA